MLQPTNRLTLIDAMRPPLGFVLESAMGVTFTLDLRALLAAPAAFALSGSERLAGDRGDHEPIELLHAVRSHANRLTVFSQVGEIALPPSRRVFAFLEKSVIPVKAPLGGVVHPKVWVLRYEVADGSPDGQAALQRLRVLIASRNLTFDASWDTVIRLDESDNGDGADLAPIGDLFLGLMSNASLAMSTAHADRVSSLSAALGAARFALPPGVDGIHVDIRGFGPKPSPFPANVDRCLIMSPFLGDDFFTEVWPSAVDELVSRPESLDLLGAIALGHIRTAYGFDDGSSPDLGSAADQLSPRDPGRPLVGLHAKVFAFEAGDQARLFLGSANATGAAFNRNVEILVELAGSATNLGIDRLCDGTVEAPGLRSLFTTYTRAEPASGEEQGTAALDGARRVIARLAIDGYVEESGTGWAIRYRSHETVPDVDATAIYCWPLASPGNRRQVTCGEPLEERFETTMETISGFLAFELRHDDGTLTQFVVPVPLHGVPEQRERLLLRALIGNAERFLRYVLALLDDDRALSDFPEPHNGRHTEGPADGFGLGGLPVIERLLRTMRRDPAKLAAIHPLVADLAAEDALPPGFAELWAAIYDVGVHGGGGS